MNATDQRPLGDALVRMGLITSGQLDAMLAVQRREGRPLSKQLVQGGFLTEDRLIQVLGEQLGVETVDLSDVSVHERVRELVLPSVAASMLVLPLARRRIGEHDGLLLAMADPLDDEAVAVVSRRLPDEMKIIRLLAGEGDLRRAVGRVYGSIDRSDIELTAMNQRPEVDDLLLPQEPSFESSTPRDTDHGGLEREATLEDAPIDQIPRDPFGDPPTVPTADRARRENLPETESAVPAVRGARAEARRFEPATQPVGVTDFSETLIPEPEAATTVGPHPGAQTGPSSVVRPDVEDDPPPVVTPVATATPSSGTRMPKSGGIRPPLPRAPATEIIRTRSPRAAESERRPAPASNRDARVLDPVVDEPSPSSRGPAPSDAGVRGAFPTSSASGSPLAPPPDLRSAPPTDRSPAPSSPTEPRERPFAGAEREPKDALPSLRDGRRRNIRDVTRRMIPSSGDPAAGPVSVEPPAPSSGVQVRSLAHRVPPALVIGTGASIVVIIAVAVFVGSRPPTVEANLTGTQIDQVEGYADDGFELEGGDPPDPPLEPLRSPSRLIAPGVMDGPPPPGHQFVLTDGIELRATAAAGAEPLLWLKAGQVVRVIQRFDAAHLVLVPPDGPAGFVRPENLGDKLPLAALARQLKFKRCVVSDGSIVDDCLYGARTQWEECRANCESGTRCAPACRAAFEACMTSCRASEQTIEQSMGVRRTRRRRGP